MTKLTKTNFKSFIKKNSANLLISFRSSFDSMSDCVTSSDNKEFRKVSNTEQHIEHSYGISGLWLVGRGRDYFKAYEDNNVTGIEVYNSCGSSIVAIAK